MNTQKQTDIEYNHKGAFASNEELFSLAATAAFLAQFSLFPNCRFSIKEMIPLINRMAGFLQRNNERYESYMELCQRILLAKGMKIKSTKQAYWFKEHFDKTIPMYEEIMEKRKANPLYRHSLKWLAEAMLDLDESGLEEKDYWMAWFRENNAVFELQIFKQAIKYLISKNKKDENKENEDRTEFKGRNANTWLRQINRAASTEQDPQTTE